MVIDYGSTPGLKPPSLSVATDGSATGTWSEYFQQAILNCLAGGVSITAPQTLFFGLWCGDSVDDEVMAQSYERVSVTNNDTYFNNLSDTIKRNSTTILFNLATEDWGIITHMAVYDMAVDGNLLWFGQLATPKEIVSGDQFSFPPSSIRLGFQV